MMEDFIGTYGNNLIVAVVGVGLALLVLAIVLWILRRRGGAAPFIRGGRNRQPRLQVLDATAVDARRRLVLVRRDNVEHLVMIGGPTDIVIESGIGAIPIVREVREPQEAELKALPRQDSEPKRAEPPIPRESRQALPQQPIAAASPASLPEEPVKQPQRPGTARPGCSCSTHPCTGRIAATTSVYATATRIHAHDGTRARCTDKTSRPGKGYYPSCATTGIGHCRTGRRCSASRRRITRHARRATGTAPP